MVRRSQARWTLNPAGAAMPALRHRVFHRRGPSWQPGLDFDAAFALTQAG